MGIYDNVETGENLLRPWSIGNLIDEYEQDQDEVHFYWRNKRNQIQYYIKKIINYLNTYQPNRFPVISEPLTFDNFTIYMMNRNIRVGGKISEG